jgi:regulator of replication initiation timing
MREEFEAELATVTQEVENYRANLESVTQELDDLRVENSRSQSRISEGTGRRATLLRSNGQTTVVGVMQALQVSHKTSSPCNPILQKTFDESLDFLMGQAVEDGEDNVCDRMIKTPLKPIDLVNTLKEVGQMFEKRPKFTEAMGAKPEKVLAYVLDLLGGLGQQRVALMDSVRAGKDAGGSVLKVMQTYYGIRSSARATATSHPTSNPPMPPPLHSSRARTQSSTVRCKARARATRSCPPPPIPVATWSATSVATTSS